MARHRLSLVLCSCLLTALLAGPPFGWCPAAAAPPGGTPICRADGAQSSPAAIPDGAGGMIVTWLDQRRGGASDLYAHHVLASGAVDPAWTANGVVVTESGTAGGPTIFPDGAGGAHVVWFDGSQSAIVAQRLRGDGSRDPAWPANGRVLVQETLGGPSGHLFYWASDRAGNVYAMWNTFDFTTERLWVQRFDASGAAAWAPVEVGSAGLGGSRFTAAALAANAFGAVAMLSSYEDLGIGFFNPAAAVSVNADGSAGFRTDLVAPFGSPFALRTFLTGLAADPAGGAFVRETVDGAVRLLRLDGTGAIVWPTDRTIAADGLLIPDDAGGVYGQSVTGVAVDRRAPDGTVPAGWTGTGLVISGAPTFGVAAAATIPGGLLLCWSENVPHKGAGIRALAVTHAGVVAPGWLAGGTPFYAAKGDQTTPTLVATSGGAGLAAWRDLRRVGGDIYGGVIAPSGAVAAMPPLDPVDPPEYPLTAGDEGVARLGAARLSLRATGIAGADGRITFALAEDGEASLELVDVGGRRLERRVVSGTRGVPQTASFSTGGLPAGVYWVRLRQGEREVAARFSHVH